MIIVNLQDFSKLIARPSRLLAIDYGKKKLGIAVSNPEQTMALPIRQIIEEKSEIRLREIESLIQEFNIKALVIGLPLNMDGTNSEQSEIVEKFAQNLAASLKLPTYLQDERLTSKAANNALKAAGFNRRERDSLDDQVAACMILETTLAKLQRIYESQKQ